MFPPRQPSAQFTLPGKIRFSGISITAANLSGISPNTTSICFSNCKSAEWSKIFGSIGLLEKMAELQFLNCPNQPEICSEIRALKHVSRLTIDGCDISMDNLAGLKETGEITDLSLNRNLLQVEQLVSKVGGWFPQLHRLAVCNTLIQGGPVQPITVSSWSKVKELRINYSKVGPVRIKLIAACLPCLSILQVDSNSLGDEGTYNIATQLPNLTYLSIVLNQLGFEGYLRLAKMAPTLQHLRIERIVDSPLLMWINSLKLTEASLIYPGGIGQHAVDSYRKSRIRSIRPLLKLQ